MCVLPCASATLSCDHAHRMSGSDDEGFDFESTDSDGAGLPRSAAISGLVAPHSGLEAQDAADYEWRLVRHTHTTHTDTHNTHTHTQAHASQIFCTLWAQALARCVSQPHCVYICALACRLRARRVKRVSRQVAAHVDQGNRLTTKTQAVPTSPQPSKHTQTPRAARSRRAARAATSAPASWASRSTRRLTTICLTLTTPRSNRGQSQVARQRALMAGAGRGRARGRRIRRRSTHVRRRPALLPAARLSR